MSDTTDLNAAIARHWSRGDPLGWIEARLAAAGIAHPDYRDVARYDQIHAGGLAAVRELAALVGVRAGERVLDLGGGLGGAARWLAGERGCEVLCLDLTAQLVAAGAALTARVGLQARVRHLVGDATATPLPAASVDGVWVQHLAQHIPAAGRLWREAARVLKPGGWLGFHEWVLGPVGAPYYPAPWAPADGSLSYLDSRDALEHALQAAGFTQLAIVDVSTAMAAAYARQLAALRAQPVADNPVLPGPESLLALANAQASLVERRAGCLMGCARFV